MNLLEMKIQDLKDEVRRLARRLEDVCEIHGDPDNFLDSARHPKIRVYLQ